MTLLDKINKTIDYARSFDGQLTFDQLYFRLLSSKQYQQKQIRELVEKQSIELAKNKSQEYLLKMELATKLVDDHLKKFNNILMVAVTGSTAAENATCEEDVDLFIICKPGTMWLTRLRLRLYIWYKGIPHRQYGQREKRNDFCFNLWIDQSDMEIFKEKQNQKNAVDLIMMKPVLNRNNAYEEFIYKNKWAKKFVANGYNQLQVKNQKLQVKSQKPSIIIRCLNWVAFLGQLTYIRLKGPIRFISPTQAFFHK